MSISTKEIEEILKRLNVSNSKNRVKGSNNNLGVILGLDETAVNKMLCETAVKIIDKIETTGEQITESAVEQVCQIVSSRFVTVCGKLDKTYASQQQAAQAMQANFAALKNDVDTFADGIYGELQRLNLRFDNVEKALNELLHDSADNAEKVMSKLDEVLSGIEKISKSNERIESKVDSLTEAVTTITETVSTIFDKSNILEISQKDKTFAALEAKRTSESLNASYQERLDCGWYYLCCGNFDEAKHAFQVALISNKQGHEAYFGLALAQHRIQLLNTNNIEEPDNFNKTPIYWKLNDDSLFNIKSFTEDANYLLAIKYSDGLDAQQKYINCAKKIADIVYYFNLYNDKSYDCFICAKVSQLDEKNRPVNNSRTEDCEWAIELHQKLVEEGFKPFFSECDISNKAEVLSTQYEALILYALSQAKCMVIVCNDKKLYDNSRFMQNEYKRFVAFSQEMHKSRDNIVLVRENKTVNLPGLENNQYLDRTDTSSLHQIIDWVKTKVLGKNVLQSVASTVVISKYCEDCKQWVTTTATVCPIHGKKFLSAEELQIKKEEEARKAELARKKADEREEAERNEQARLRAERKAKEEAERLEAERKAKIACDFQIDGTVLVKYSGNDSAVVIPNDIKEIGIGAFRDCINIITVTIPDSITIIRDFAFQNCSLLTSITIPDSVTSIGGLAFDGCSSLTNISMLNSVTFVGAGAFRDCSNLKYNEYDNALYLGNDSNSYVVLVNAKDKSITSCTVNENTKVIACSAFECCVSLKSITISNGVTTVCSGAFFSCVSLTSVTFPDSVTDIGIEAFYNCSSLTSITIPDNVTDIGWRAFKDCRKLRYNKYGKALYLGNGGNPYLVLVKAKNRLIVSCAINENTKVIADSAFSNCSLLTSITIPNSVTGIGEHAFYGCKSLQTIRYNGTKADWDKISKHENWNYYNLIKTVICTDGTIDLTDAN